MAPAGPSASQRSRRPDRFAATRSGALQPRGPDRRAGRTSAPLRVAAKRAALRARGPNGDCGIGAMADTLFTVQTVEKYCVVEFRTNSLMNPSELEQIATDLYRL